MATGNDECEQYVSEHVCLPVNEQHPDPYRSQQHVKRAVTKGYKHVWIIPRNENIIVQSILCHLNKAIEGGNAWASLEKGIVFRQIRKPKEAFETFLTTLEMEEYKTSIIEVSCYEHLGACCKDLAECERNSQQKRNLEKDAVKYLLKAIEKVAKKAHVALNFLRDGWMALPMLNDMFNPQESDKAMLEELIELRNMLRQYGDLSGLHDMIMKPEEEIHENIKTLLKQKEFEKASALLAVQNCVQDTRISKGLQKLAYVKYAFNLVRINKMEEARQRLQQAFVVDCSDNSELEYDIFFLYDEETDTKIDGEPTPASFLSKTVGEFSVCESGLRFTRNSHQVKPGRWRAQEQTKLMQSSMHIVLILDENEEPKGELQYFINIAKEIHNVIKSKLSLILVNDSPCPLDLKPFPHMHFERKLIQCPDSYILWVRKFFFNLLDVSDIEDNVCDSLDTCLRVY